MMYQIVFPDTALRNTVAEFTDAFAADIANAGRFVTFPHTAVTVYYSLATVGESFDGLSRKLGTLIHPN